MLCATVIKDGYEDLHRHRWDWHENNVFRV